MTLLAAFIEYCVSCAPSGNAIAPVVGTAAGIAGAAGALAGASSPSTPSGSIAGGPGGGGDSTGLEGAGGNGTTPMSGGGAPPTVTILDGGATGQSRIVAGYTFYEYVYTVKVNGSISVYTQWLDTLDPAKAAADAFSDIQNNPDDLGGDLGGIA